MTVLLVALGLATAVVAYVLHPLVAGLHAPLTREDEELTDAQHRKRVALLALRDVEYDYHAGKLDEEDYRALRGKISSEALEALDAEESEWAVLREGSGGRAEGGRGWTGSDVEAEIAALRASIREGVVCPECANPNPRGSRYCGECGSALPRPRGTSGGP